MKRQISRSRRSRFARISALTVLLTVAVAVLCNVMVTTLVRRYEWYTPLIGEYRFETSEASYTILESAFESSAVEGVRKKLQIRFCDTEATVSETDNICLVYQTAKDLSARYPQQIELIFNDILVNPDAARPYMAEVDPLTGETFEFPLDATSVIVTCEDRFSCYTIYDFFAYKDADVSTSWAYKGERVLLGGMIGVLYEERPSVVLTSNHGEEFYDTELFAVLEDAGYIFRYMDLYREEIPADCDLLLTFNPRSDFTSADGVAEVSETEKVAGFLAQEGNSFLVMIDSKTPSLPNLERLLEDWGISTEYHKDALTGYSTRIAVRDEAHSLTSDGYTIYGEAGVAGVNERFIPADGGVGAVFKDATALKVAAGYLPQGNGVFTKGDRTVYGLYYGSEDAVSYANGIAVGGERPLLMAVTEERRATGASSFVGVLASTQFAAEDYLQTAVYENPHVLFTLAERIGLPNTPKSVPIQPFLSTTISSITTAQMWRWTLLLALTPAVAVTTVAVWTLVRRRRA